SFTVASIAIAAISAVAFANKPAAAAPAAQYAYAAPVTVIANAATVEPTVTVTHINGASSNIFSLGAAALAGTLALASFM
ncbi:hypothetical protein H4S04_008105, partial [Coemansia sp. S16]